MKLLKLALDWTANANHIGFFVAKQKGYYQEVGLEVELLTPDQDDYKVTPAKKVELGEAHFALCPFESIVSYRTKQQVFDAVAIAALFKEDLSAIVTLGDGKLRRPSDLDGTMYASYQARYEDEIVRQMIRNDGGKGEIEIVHPKKLGIWETIVNKKYDVTWIFMNWEGIQAEGQGISLNEFRMADYGIPYSYSPVIMTGKRLADANAHDFSNFLQATKKGYLFAQDDPKAAIDSLAPFVAKQDRDIDLLQSVEFTVTYCGTTANWGVLEKSKVDAYLNWLHDTGLEPQRLPFETLVFQGLL